MNFFPFSMFPTTVWRLRYYFQFIVLLLFSLILSWYSSLKFLITARDVTARSCSDISEQATGEAPTAHIFFSLVAAFTVNWNESPWRAIKLCDVTLQEVKLGVLSCTAFYCISATTPKANISQKDRSLPTKLILSSWIKAGWLGTLEWHHQIHSSAEPRQLHLLA